MSTGEYAPRRGAGIVEVDRHDGVDGFALARMVFTHADPAPPPVVEHAIAVAPSPSLPSPVCGGGKGGGRRQRLGVGLGVALPILALVGEVRKDRYPAGHQPRRAAIFMDA